MMSQADQKGASSEGLAGGGATNERGHLSAVQRDELLLGILTGPERTAAENHCAACPACQQALETQRVDHQVFAERVLPQTLARMQPGQTALAFFSRRRWWLLLAPASAAALIALLFLPSGPQSSDRAGVRVKGDPTLRIVAKRGEAVFVVQPGVRLRPRDRIRFVVDPAGAAYLLIVSRDGAGRITRYYPPVGETSARVGQGRFEIPGSIELDDAVGVEWIHGILSDAPLSTSAVLEIVGSHGAGKLDAALVPGAQAIVSLAIEKEPE